MQCKHIFTLLSFLIIGGIFTLLFGQDINFDLRNYHFYNAYSYVNDRFDYDLYPAQLQNFLNPLLDVLYYKIVVIFSDPMIVTFIMGLWYGLLAWSMFRLITLFQPQKNTLLALSATVLSVSSAATIGQVGTTTNEMTTSALIAISFLLCCTAMKNEDNHQNSYLRLGGFIAGITTGLKFTAASYSLAIIFGIGLFALINRRRHFISMLTNFIGMSIFGFLLTGGYWHYFLWNHFDSPIFPFYNHIFKSDYYEHVSLYVSAWRRTTLENLFLYPFQLSQIDRPKKEDYFSDPHLMIGFVTSLLLLGMAGIQSIQNYISRHTVSNFKNIDPFIIVIPGVWLFGYIIWAYTHGTYRYTVFLEALSSILLILFFYQCKLSNRWVTVIMMAITVTTIHYTTYLSWGRINYGQTTFDVHPPEIKSNSMVIMLSGDAMSYVIPFFPKEVRFAYPKCNLNSVELKNKLQQHINETIKKWDGPLYAMAPVGYNFASDKALAYFSFNVDYMGSYGCKPIISNIDNNRLQICELKRN